MALLSVRRPISFAPAGAHIRRILKDASPPHCRRKEAYTENFAWSADCQATSVGYGADLLARLRVGLTLLSKANASQLGTFANSICADCGGELLTLERWLWRCPNDECTRQNTFGSRFQLLPVLTNDPVSALVC